MKSYTLIAPAKINLHLEILGIRPDNYHELVMVMQTVDLADRVELRSLATDDIILHCGHPNVPLDRTNLAYRAAELMQQEFPDALSEYGGVEITLHKHIPIAAGLAGGSGNAAAVLVGIDLLWELGLTQGDLQKLGSRLGSDVPFCISGGTAIATGRGDVISPLPSLDGIYVVLGKYQSLAVSTPWAYTTYRHEYEHDYPQVLASLATRSHQIHSGDLVRAIVARDAVKIGKLLYNDLEKVVLPAYPQVSQLRAEFQRHANLGTMMSGSGPTVFSLATSLAQAETIYHQVRAAIPDPDLELFVTQFSDRGVRVV
ncbi:4-(cytidine 5'-diphospho)-2-C-methyl-D-erythritol kinase [Chamaesiphon sp. OTE_8_metabat_110]|uniref:4-(cytidine 5'-diphospho)-2-C-methyl-D-erythritol kinase n=1 Tax=Chamaesiphon sp. OTE_8_metabat_110 TaxID=2964696 RepID=UPI00286AFC20|nr:4-(cytidine 5'-diphospho)-2-C-methyl-D-erythritol kinase [Chamaesiphon sp. OTE_8_metabat_110]